MKGLEDKLQEHCVRWFRYSYPDVIIFAIPNGGSRNAIEAAKLKRTGTLAGVADLYVMKSHSHETFKDNYFDVTIYHGLFVELKIGKNNQTPAQAEFMLNAKNAGYGYVVCRSLEEFIQIVNDYLN
jgi:hypothetical protein